jgi:hypothetical protein
MYFASYRLGDGIVASRSLMCVADHMAFSAIWGYALGKRLVSREKGVLLRFFALAALLHGAHDTIVAYGVPFGALASTILATVVFVALVRRALRWGSLGEIGGEAPHSSRRTLFGVGRSDATALLIAVMFGLDALIEVVARGAENDHVRVALGVLVASTTLAALLALAAWGVTRVMPLDVVLDEVGVTFAGALRRWGDIRGVTRPRASALVVHASTGDLRVGPGTRPAIDALEAALRGRIGDRDRDHGEGDSAGDEGERA